MHLVVGVSGSQRMCGPSRERGGKNRAFVAVADCGVDLADKALTRLDIGERKGAGNGCVHESEEVGGGLVEAMGSPHYDADARVGQVDTRAGDNRVRHPRRRARRHSHTGDHGFQAEVAGAVECDCRRHKRVVGLAVRDEGQSTVEFAVVTAGFLSATVALSLLWHAFGDGMLVKHALAVASHHVQAVFPATVADIFLY